MSRGPQRYDLCDQGSRIRGYDSRDEGHDQYGLWSLVKWIILPPSSCCWERDDILTEIITAVCVLPILGISIDMQCTHWRSTQCAASCSQAKSFKRTREWCLLGKAMLVPRSRGSQQLPRACALAFIQSSNPVSMNACERAQTCIAVSAKTLGGSSIQQFYTPFLFFPCEWQLMFDHISW